MMIKLIKNTKHLDERLKEDKVAKSKRLRESICKTNLDESDTFEVDDEDTSIKPVIPTIRKIEEIVKSYDLDELDDLDIDTVDEALNEIILDCMSEVKPRVEAYSSEWDELYRKLEKLVYKVVKRLGYLPHLKEGFDDKDRQRQSINSNVEKIDKLINDIYDERKTSIAKDGEYGVGNQTFKEFRNRGYLTKLKRLKQKELNKELSLESFKEER